MSVAENPVVQQRPRNPRQEAMIASAVGAVVVLACLWFVFAGLPMLWSSIWDPFWANLGYVRNDILAGTLLVLVELIVIGALCVGAYRAMQLDLPHGARAGIVVLALGIFASLCLGGWLVGAMAASSPEDATLGWGVAGLVTAALLAGLGYLFLMVPAWVDLLEQFEAQGWFHGTSYKGNQGVRVRRATIMGVIAVGACGIITLVTGRFFGYERVADDGSLLANDWFWTVPYATSVNQMQYVPLMFKVHLIIPLLLAIGLVYFAWRLVNVPTFADFLIATEAEMNKVSWTNRKRLWQDTIVVLTTVFLFTGFLFVVDILWIRILSNPYIHVLQVDFKKEQQKQQEKAEW